ncbi:MAG: tetratricopeptide repeat protein, partial [Bacteroidales bacterium]|nr:tetratricopeptide repeat protein [Bacteroidales bacterium]
MHYKISVLAVCILGAAFSLSGENRKETAQGEIEANRRKFDYFFLESLKAKKSGKLDTAFELLQHCYWIDSLNPQVLYEMSLYYRLFNNNSDVVATLQKAIELEPSNFWYQRLLASQCESMRQFETAIETYENMIRTFPDKPELNYDLASLYAQNGNTEKAIDALNQLENIIGINETISIQK